MLSAGGTAGAGQTYYVNDALVQPGDFTIAPGNDTNSGLDPAHPKASIAALFNAYPIGAGDVIEVDLGTYPLSGNIVIGASHSGVVIRGFYDVFNLSRVATISRTGTAAGSDVFDLQGATNVTLDHLNLTGGAAGVYAGDGAGSTGLTISNSNLYGSGDYGVFLGSGNSGATFTNNLIHDTANASGVGIYARQDQISASVNTVYNNARYGIDVEAGNNSTVSGNMVYGNGTGIVADTAAVTGNTVRDNLNDGIIASGNSTVSGNSTFHNVGANGSPGAGIELLGGTAQGNVSFNNAYGVLVSGAGTVANNRLNNNTAAGISCGNGVSVSGNVINSNGWGIQANVHVGAVTSFTNNVIYSNVNGGLQLVGGYNTPVINNTIYQTAGDALDVLNQAGQTNISVRDNIFWVTGGYDIKVDSASQAAVASDYNDLYFTGSGQVGYWQGTGQGTLGAWRQSAGQDADTISTDPLFVSVAGADFHEQSLYGSFHGGALAPFPAIGGGLPSMRAGTLIIDANQSPAIDRGDPASAFALEPAPNGGYVNLGAFGNTAQASKSPAAYVLVIKPAGGESAMAGQTLNISWRASNMGTGLVDIDLMSQSGGTGPAWQNNIVTATPNSGQYVWNIPESIPTGANYLVRVACEGGNASGTSLPIVITSASVPVVAPFAIAATVEGTATAPVNGSFAGQAGDSFTATVDYGDGSGPQSLPLSGNSFTLTHAYIEGGGYTVSVVVTDTTANLTSAPSAASVSVSDVAVVATISGAPASIPLGGSVSLSFTASNPNALETGPLVESWTIQDGSSAVVASGTGGPCTFMPAAAGVYTVSFSAGESATADDETGTATVTITVSPATPTYLGTQIDDGNRQRSEIRSLTFQFSSPVTLSAGAITLAVSNAAGSNSGTNDGSAPTDASAALDLAKASTPNGGMTWVVPFIKSVAGFTDGSGSLVDNVYAATIHANLMTDAYGQHLTGGDQIKNFHRLYGDVTGAKNVNNADFTQFSNTYGLGWGEPHYNRYFDFKGPTASAPNGSAINNADFTQFSNRFGKKLVYLAN
jgi:Right handed beta helix region/PKD domain/Ser-Thr-rich glycosyl-phosphatidyl-inositol-anchored membrane family